MSETIDWWRHWSAETAYAGRYADDVRRSAVVLKGLTCGPTGAVVAAPTTSLPEEIGGVRNWDNRFSWIRDATLVVAALAVAGQTTAARGFRNFILRSAGGKPEEPRIMYGLDGTTPVLLRLHIDDARAPRRASSRTVARPTPALAPLTTTARSRSDLLVMPMTCAYPKRRLPSPRCPGTTRREMRFDGDRRPPLSAASGRGR